MFDENNGEEEVVLEPQEEEDTIEEVILEEEESIDEVRTKLAKAEELANNQKIRAEKAEAKAKLEPKTEQKLSTFDLLALQKANIETEEDLDEITRWADYNKISVSEALKSKVLQTVLTEKSEERKSAIATNVGSSRRGGGGAISDERLMSDAEKGIMPDSSEDIARLTRLRLKNR